MGIPCMVQTIGMILGGTAMLLTFAVCGMPHWRVSLLVEGNSYGKRLDGHWISRWDGLWMTCVRQSHNPMSCNSYSTSVSLTPDLKAAKVLMIFAVLFAVFGFLNGLMGMLFNKCCTKNKRNTENRHCLLLLTGISYITAGILVLIPVTLIAVNVMRQVCFSSCQTVQQQEIGEAVMLGWPTALLFFIGGSIFCWYHPCKCRDKRCACAYPSEECQPETELQPCPEAKPLATELRVFKINTGKNGDLIL